MKVLDKLDKFEKEYERYKKSQQQALLDPVNQPIHYTKGGIETIDFIEAKDLGFHLGNVVKYISRAGHKNDLLEDLKKARWYLDRKIKILEKKK